MSSPKNCQAKVEAHLLNGGSITQLSALSPKFDYAGRLSEIIRRLRLKHGKKTIKTVMVKNRFGVFAKYSIPL